MNHEEAIQTNAVEAYVLGELPSPERDAFEEHYFGCAACFDALQQAETFAQNARLAARYRQKQAIADNVRPFRPRAMRWASSLAAALLLALSVGTFSMWLNAPKQGGYPHLFLSGQAGQLRGANDGSGNRLPAHRWANLYVEIPVIEDAVSYRLELRGPVKTRHYDVGAEEAKETVNWFLSPLPPGNYDLVFLSVDRGGKRSEITMQPIQVGGGS